jgi:hypothetical protein
MLIFELHHKNHKNLYMNGRMQLTRSSGEQTMFGVFSVLPLEHIIAFLMGTHRRLGREDLIKFLPAGVSSKKTSLYFQLVRYDTFLLQMIVNMAIRNVMLAEKYAKFPALRKMMGVTR